MSAVMNRARATAFDDLESPADLGPAPGRDNGEGDAAFDAEVAMYSRKGQIAATGKPADTFPCQSCGGTGRYRGMRLHQEKAHCFACKGAGHFKTSEWQRKKAKASSAKRKRTALEDKLQAFEEQSPGIAAAVRSMASWSEFAGKLVGDLDKFGRLTDGQLRAVRSMMAKRAATAEESKVERSAKSGEVDASAIRSMFDRASRTGLKKPAFAADRIRFSLAPPGGKNPGAIYVKVDDEYAGKITGGTFLAVASAPADTLQRVIAIAADPKGEAIRYGKLTGRCACCSRELTDPASVAAGIGPICAAGWF